MRIATPVSDLFFDPAAESAILNLSDVLELRHPGQRSYMDSLWIFHSELSLVARWTEADRKDLRCLATPNPPELISFHMGSRYERNILSGGAYVGIGVPYTPEEMIQHARTNVDFLRVVFGPHIPILVENNNDLGTDAYAVVTDGSFIARVVEEGGIHFLWDIAHSRITAANRGIDHEAYLKDLPLGRCLQVHLSRHGLSHGMAYDAHECLQEGEWVYAAAQMDRLDSLMFAAVEYYKDAAVLQEQLKRLKFILKTTEKGGGTR